MPRFANCGHQQAFFFPAANKTGGEYARFVIPMPSGVVLITQSSFMYNRKEITARSFAVEQNGRSIVKA